MKPPLQFTLRSLLLATLCFCVYLGLSSFYGWGRAVLCVLNILMGACSLLFVGTAWASLREDNLRNAAGSLIIATMILSGSLLCAALVFQPVR